MWLMGGLAESNDTLRNLYLDANGITSAGAVYIADYFRKTSALARTGVTSLWLDMNRLGDKGVSELAYALTCNTTLERLVVGSNRLTWRGLSILCYVLEKHPSLFLLSLGAYLATADMGELTNRIGDEGALFIADLIRRNPKLKVLNVVQNNISNVGLQEIANALLQNSSILMLEFQQYGLDIWPETKASVNASLTRNIVANLDGMSFREFQEHSLKRELQHTKDIWNIDSIYRNSGRNNGRLKKRVT
jgi:Ran GTPase-activating protein (RanGAP) involved in mRNA processing and transport